jgi:acetolactate synthase-1/2/3 large subunit
VVSKLTGGEALARALERWGVKIVFGLPGVHLDHLFDALHGMRERIRVIHTRHEQGAAYMALGHAMASGSPGICAVVPGPGLLNTGAALATAYACSAPVLCLTTTIVRPLLDRQYGALHDVPDQSGVLQRLTKWCARVTHPAAIPEHVDEAFKQMLSGRPRPVALEIPPEVLGESAPIRFRDAPVAPDTPPVDGTRIADAVELIATAVSPIIVVGGGAQHARDPVRVLAELIQAPVISRQMGRGVLDDRHDLALPAAAAAPFWREADLVIGIGTRLQQLREWGADARLRVIRIDVDPMEIHRLSAPAVAVTADARAATSALCEALRGRGVRAAKPVAARVRMLRDAFRKELGTTLAPQMSWLSALRDALPDDGVFVEDLTQVGYAAKIDFPVHAPRTYLCSGYEGTLGAGYPMALGAQAALPERRVLSVSGDGGFMFNVQELSSAMLHKLPVVAVVFNDGRYGNVQMIQQRWYGGRQIATELHNPDFVALAQSFGAAAYRVPDPDALRDAIAKSFERGLPSVIEAPFDIDAMPWPWDYLIPKRVRPASEDEPT